MARRPTYAGIGSRETPADICQAMTNVAANLEAAGMVLRSGGADGADLAFEAGVSRPHMKEIFLPWKGFNGSRSTLYWDPTDEAIEMAASLHPAWDRLSQGAQKLMVRNCYQVLGEDLDDPVRFVLCWTPRGSGSGGTGQAIRLARRFEIPVIDLGGMSFDQAAERIRPLIPAL